MLHSCEKTQFRSYEFLQVKALQISSYHFLSIILTVVHWPVRSELLIHFLSQVTKYTHYHQTKVID